MSITHADLCALAVRLSQGGHEADHRSCISRAYYAAYHFAMQWEAALPCRGSEAGPGGGEHQKLVNRLLNPAPECSVEQKASSKKLGARINHFKTKRRAADYELGTTDIDSSSAIQAVSDAQMILSS